MRCLPDCGAEARMAVPLLQTFSVEEEDSGRSLRPRGASMAGPPTGRLAPASTSVLPHGEDTVQIA